MSDELDTTSIDSGLNALTGRRNVLKGASGLALGSLGLSGLAGSDRGCHAAPLAQDATPRTPGAGKQPNILFIMGDDIGWMNVDAYHRGIMEKTNPNLDQLANEGAIFNDYYAEASCTAGRANFITGQLPIRTGLTTVGQAGRGRRHAGHLTHDRHGAEEPGLHHRAVRQEPPRRPQRVPAHGPRLRRVLRLPLPPRRHAGPVQPRLPAGSAGHRRSAQPHPLLRQRHRRHDRGSALGQGRQADHHRRRPAAAPPDGRHQIQHGDLRRGHPRLGQRLHRAGGQPTTSRSSSG